MKLLRPPPTLTSLAEFSLSVPPPKVVGYLLDPNHPDNKGKAKFLARFGYTRGNASELSINLAIQAFDSSEVSAEPHPLGYGMRVSARGLLRTPRGDRPWIRTCWRWYPGRLDAQGLERADFVTAFPD